MIAEKAAHLPWLDRQRRMVERLVKKTQDGTLGTPTDDTPEAEEMRVEVGDKTENHYYGTKADGATSDTRDVADKSRKAPMKSGVLGPLALAAALVIGLLVGVWGGDLFDRGGENGENVGTPPIPVVQPAAEQWLRVTVEEPETP